MLEKVDSYCEWCGREGLVLRRKGSDGPGRCEACCEQMYYKILGVVVGLLAFGILYFTLVR